MLEDIQAANYKNIGMSSKIKDKISEDSVTEFSKKIKNFITKTIVKAKRSKLWWKLGNIEKGILTLATKLDIKFKSLTLLKAIVKIVKQISQQTSYMRKHYILGLKTAYKTVEYAISIGYVQAKEWLKEKAYIIWHGIIVDQTTYTR